MRRPFHPLLIWLLAGLLLLTQYGGLQHALGHAVGLTSSAAQRQPVGSPALSRADAPGGSATDAATDAATHAATLADADEPADGACLVCLALAGLGIGLVLALLRWQAPKASGDQALPPPSRAPPSRPRPAYAARAPPVFQH